MAAELILTPEALRDLAEAHSWYETQRAGLGEQLLEHVDACLQAICRSPSASLRVRGQSRRRLVRKFPYAVYYDFADNTVTVHGVLHTARDSDAWQQRLP